MVQTNNKKAVQLASLFALILCVSNFTLIKNYRYDSYFNPDHAVASNRDEIIIVEKLPKSHVVQTDIILKEKAADLKRMKTRFYMYDDANITLDGNPLLEHLNRRQIHRMGDAVYDEEILAALHKSDLRTLEPDEADLFIVPTPICRVLMSRNLNFHVPFQALVNHEIFRKHHGNNHVLVSSTFVLFRRHTKFYTSLGGWYDKIWNTTVMLSWDPNAVYDDLFKAKTNWGEYQDIMTKPRGSPMGPKGPLTSKSASIGLGSKNDCLKMSLATKERFYNSSNFVFYHSTTAT